MGRCIGYLDCKNKIIRFLKLEHKNNKIEALNKQEFDLEKAIDYLETFDFKKLNKDSFYRNNVNYSEFYSKDDNIHCDMLPLTRAIYVVVWSSVFENLLYGEIGYKGDYTRETILSNGSAYIGNFMLLPSKTYNSQSFNTYRNHLNNDDFKEFLELIKKIYSDLEKSKYNFEKFEFEHKLPYWNEIVKANSFYFDKIKTYDEFLNINFLKDFENSENFIKRRSKIICSILKYNLK